ncbi:reverse transcriptase domain-containing protein [Tanacetum coccineum]
MGVKNLEVNVDSKLVANQVNGTYIAKETDMVKYLEKVKALTNTFRAFLIKQVPKNKNKKARCISKKGVHQFLHISANRLLGGGIERKNPINEKEVLAVVEEEGDTWMTPIHEYLTDETLPSERKKARAIKRPSHANYVLREIHEGSCSMHAGTRSVVAKALRTGYYWFDTSAQGRKRYKSHSGMPTGPFPEGPGKVKFLIVAMDYFTKWIEAKPVATITGKARSKRFVGSVKTSLCIQQHFASVKHPQTNGLVERANRSLGEGIKARLGKENKNWLEEISHVLWAHRTMIKSSNGDTPFLLTYRTEAVIPAEIGMPTVSGPQK